MIGSCLRTSEGIVRTPWCSMDKAKFSGSFDSSSVASFLGLAPNEQEVTKRQVVQAESQTPSLVGAAGFQYGYGDVVRQRQKRFRHRLVPS